MWLIFSQLSALSETVSNLLAKKILAEYDAAVVTWFWVTTSLVVMFPIVLWQGIPSLQPLFFIVLLTRVVLDTLALLLFTKALQLAEVSLITPLFNFSAVFSLLFSAVVNQELPTVGGILGVALIVAGAYGLNFKPGQSEWWLPIVHLLRNRASVMMLSSTVLYGLIFSISKVGIEASSLSFYTFAAAAGLSLSIFPIAWFKNKADLIKILQPHHAIKVIPLGIVDAVKILALMATIQTTYVTFADAANNTSIVYNQIAAKVFLREHVTSRLIPTLLMFAGLVLIVVSG